MSKSKLARITAILLAAMTALSACGGGDEGPVNGDTGTTPPASSETEPAATEPHHKLPDTDWKGREFRILGQTNATYAQFVNFEIDAAEITGELVNDAVYNRNTKITEKYNAKVVGTYVTETDNTVQTAVLAGENAHDLAFTRLARAGAMSAAGMFIDFNKLEHVDFTAPWWNESVNSELSVFGKLYFTTSSFNLMDKNRTYSMRMNKDMLADFKLGNIYEIVEDGKWTVDVMSEMCKKVAADLNGNGAIDATDRFGYGTDSYNAFYVNWVGCDNLICKKNKDDQPVIDVLNDHSLKSVDRLLELYNDKAAVMIPNEYQGKVDYDYWSTSSFAFYENRLLFATTFTHSLKSTSAKTDVDYGVIPNPKLDEKQENYISAVDPPWGALLAIPATNIDYDFTGFMLELLSETTYYEVMPEYYEVSCKTKYTYDEESGKMLDLVFANLRYDLAIIYNWGSVKNWFVNDLPKEGVNDLATRWAASQSTIENEIKATLEAYEKLAG